MSEQKAWKPEIGEVVWWKAKGEHVPALVFDLYKNGCALFVEQMDYNENTVIGDAYGYIYQLSELTDEHRAQFPDEIALLKAASVLVRKKWVDK